MFVDFVLDFDSSLIGVKEPFLESVFKVLDVTVFNGIKRLQTLKEHRSSADHIVQTAFRMAGLGVMVYLVDLKMNLFKLQISVIFASYWNISLVASPYSI